ncbi:MAG: hypothetical protein ACRYGC_11895 [Janthinobacterium lividum]
MSGAHLDRLRAALAQAAPSPRLRAVLPGLLALAVAAEAFALLGPGAVQRRLASEATQIAAAVEEEDAALRSRLHAAASPTAASRDVDPVAFLREARASAAHGTSEVTRLVPRPHDPRTLDVELLASFPAFLDLAAGMERLGARLQGVRLRAAEAGSQGASRQSVSFALEVPRRLAAAPPEPAPPDPAPRDPFAAPPAEDAAQSRRYVLTGLTRTAGGPVATINDRDYAVGDRLGALTVTAIDDAEVTLGSGTRQLRLRLGHPG